jgi:hypothetical protein
VGEALAGAGIDDFAGGAGFGGAESAGERAGVADGDEGIEGAGGEEDFAGAGDGFGAHARTGGDGIDRADAAGGHIAAAGPVMDERAELAG